MWPKKYPVISMAKQFYALASSSICPGRGALKMGRLVWEFSARPSPLSREYRLRIDYNQGGVPKVFVLAPDLIALAGEKDLPHVYQLKPTQLCLFLPGAGEWSSDKWIFKTIVPWAILWLFYFEDWLITGEWQGGGKHPELKNEKRKKNTRN